MDLNEYYTNTACGLQVAPITYEDVLFMITSSNLVSAASVNSELETEINADPSQLV
jgi:hypothetical protein